MRRFSILSSPNVAASRQATTLASASSTQAKALLAQSAAVLTGTGRGPLFLWLLVMSAIVLWSPNAALAQCGSCGCPAGQDCYCSGSNCYCVPGTPVLIDLKGDGFKLTGPAEGVQFDFFLNGPVQISWTPPDADEGWLVLPPKDGKIENGAEMFGNLTPQPSSPDPNGFNALAVYDDPSNGGNNNGIIDPGDAIFSKLRIWRDSNHNGISEPWELIDLQNVGIKSISLSYIESGYIDRFGNRFRYRARVVSNGGVDKWAYDVILQFIKPTTTSGVSADTRQTGNMLLQRAFALRGKQTLPRVQVAAGRTAAASFLVIWWSRALIGLLLSAAGVLKILDLSSFRAAVRGFALLPEKMTSPAAYALVAAEVVTGVLALTASLFNVAVLRWACVGAAVLFALFGIALSINLARGRRDIACGCFNGAETNRISWALVIRNLVLCFIALLGFQSVASGHAYGHGSERVEAVLLAIFTLLVCKLFFTIRELYRHGRELTAFGGVE